MVAHWGKGCYYCPQLIDEENKAQKGTYIDAEVINEINWRHLHNRKKKKKQIPQKIMPSYDGHRDEKVCSRGTVAGMSVCVEC